MEDLDSTLDSNDETEAIVVYNVEERERELVVTSQSGLDLKSGSIQFIVFNTLLTRPILPVIDDVTSWKTGRLCFTQKVIILENLMNVHDLKKKTSDYVDTWFSKRKRKGFQKNKIFNITHSRRQKLVIWIEYSKLYIITQCGVFVTLCNR